MVDERKFMKSDSTRPCFAVDIDNVLARAEREVQRIFWELTGTPWPRGKYGSAGGLNEGDFAPDVIEKIFSRFHEQSIPLLPMLPGAKFVLKFVAPSISDPHCYSKTSYLSASNLGMAHGSSDLF